MKHQPVPLTYDELAAKLEMAVTEIKYLNKRIKSLEYRMNSQDALEDVRLIRTNQPREYFPEY